MSGLDEIDWEQSVDQIFSTCLVALKWLKENNDNQEIQLFIISSDYVFGDVIICADTKANSMANAEKHAKRVFRKLLSTAGIEGGWQLVRDQLMRHTVNIYNPHTAEFAYPSVARLQVPAWKKHFADENIDESSVPSGKVVLALVKVVDRLVSAKHFEGISSASPLLIGFELPREESELTIVKIINWGLK